MKNDCKTMVLKSGVELINKDIENQRKRGYWPWKAYNNEICPRGRWGGYNHCEVKHRYRTVCGRGDCPICGKENSFAHHRRYQRGRMKIKEMLEEGYVGYMVITCNENERKKWDNKKELNRIGKYVIRMLKRELGKNLRGVAVWHYSGEKSHKWYPHLNVLFNRGYIEEEKLKEIKEKIYKKIGVKVVNYRYSRNIKRVINHWWKYITRPTFLLQNEVEYEKIKGMKNIKWFGKFKKEKEYERMSGEDFLKMCYEWYKEGYFKSVKDMARFIIVNNRCIMCGEKQKWKPINLNEIDNSNNDWKDLGWGIFVKKE